MDAYTQTHTHTYRCLHRNNIRKPGALATDQHMPGEKALCLYLNIKNQDKHCASISIQTPKLISTVITKIRLYKYNTLLAHHNTTVTMPLAPIVSNNNFISFRVEIDVWMDLLLL